MVPTNSPPTGKNITSATPTAHRSSPSSPQSKTDRPSKRSPPALLALRPNQSKAFTNVQKIPTLGIRSAFVGQFEVKDHPLPQSDIIAQGRKAWDAALGTVTLGKFFLGFGSIGICEHAFDEAITHVTNRILFGKPVIEMPHIASLVSQAYARLTAMKLYAYRALDYVHAASDNDRRYILFNAVQKAKVSTEGVKVMALLSECIGAHGFESNTYFEMALRDIQLIPGLEGSTHINLTTTAQFIPAYFTHPNPDLPNPKSLTAAQCPSTENPYLMEAQTGSVNTITFPHFLNAYRPLRAIPNIRIFARQAKAFRHFILSRSFQAQPSDLQTAVAIGNCQAAIAYAELVAENSIHLNVPPQIVSVIFHQLVNDLSLSALALASSKRLDSAGQSFIRHLVSVPRTPDADWNFVLTQAASTNSSSPLHGS